MYAFRLSLRAVPVQNTLSLPRFAFDVFKTVRLLRASTGCYGRVKCGGGRSQKEENWQRSLHFVVFARCGFR